MINIYGYFKDIKNNTRYDVNLIKLSGGSLALSIEEDSDIICFDYSNPVVIETDYSDTFSHVIIKQATINLVVKNNLKSVFFANNSRDFSVNIEVHDGPVLFKGYIDPLVFNEPYNKDWTRIQLSCSDKLATLQYRKYGELPDINPNSQDKPITIINNICASIGLTADINSLSSEIKHILNNTYINNQILFGESPDDWMKCDEVLEEIGKYAGIWFSQEEDNKLRCFSWHNLEREGARAITRSDFSGSDTNISVSDVFTQVRLTCDLEKQEKLAEFGSSDLVPVFPSKGKYMEEYVSEDTGTNELIRFMHLVKSHGATQDSDNVYKLDCYAQVYKSNTWDFGSNNYLDIAESYGSPQYVLYWLRQHPGNGAFIGYGKTEKQSLKNTNPIPSVNLTQCLIISVMGQDNKNDTSTLSNFSNPICTYRGKASSIVPPNTGVTNYIVISGKIYLNPLYAQSGLNMHGGYFNEMDGGLLADSNNTFQQFYNFLTSNFQSGEISFWDVISLFGCKVDYRDGYYLQRYMMGDSQTSLPMLFGDLKWPKYTEQWEYKWSVIDGSWQEVDDIKKIPILVCQLKVGNKYCVERFDQGPSGWNKFEWLTEDECPWDYSHNERNKYFTIGIDPTIGDKILGKDYDISNTIKHLDDVDGKGLAIPITTDDMLNGDFEFKILRPADVEWNYLNKRYHGWWITEYEIRDNEFWPIVQKLSSIIVKNLKVELISDKGHLTNLDDDADLVYASDMNDDYVEAHEDNIKISTMLTSYECSQRNVDLAISPSHLVNTDGSPYLGMSYTTNGTYTSYIKPEDWYVNNFYNEYSKPRTVIESTLELKNQFTYIIKPYSYKFSFNQDYYEGGDFVPIRYEAELKENKVKYAMKNMS